jgi:hypothetical protein
LEPRAALAALLTGDLISYGRRTTAGRRCAVCRCESSWFLNRSTCVVAAKEFTSVEQLRGKTFCGYTPRASVVSCLLSFATQGLRPEDYKILNMGTARAALLSGSIPAAVLRRGRLVTPRLHVLARANEEFELTSGGLAPWLPACKQTCVMRSAIQAALEGCALWRHRKIRWYQFT